MSVLELKFKKVEKLFCAWKITKPNSNQLPDMLRAFDLSGEMNLSLTLYILSYLSFVLDDKAWNINKH